jgi:acetyl esterase
MMKKFLLIPIVVLASAVLYLQYDGRPLQLIYLDNYLYWVEGLTRISNPKDIIPFQSEKYSVDSTDGIDSVSGHYADRNHTLKSGVTLPVRIYFPPVFDPTRAKRYNVFVWFHGGGWSMGHYNDYDRLLAPIANNTENTIIFSVEYRLAPQHKFPIGLNDCWEHLLFITERAQEFNIDASKIVIGGEDTGGNFAAVLAQRSRKDRHVELAGQYLCCPVLSYGKNDTTSQLKYKSGYLLTSSLRNATLWGYITGKSDQKSPEVWPALTTDLSGLPSALFHICEFDPYTDDTMEYAKRMIEAAVPVKVRQFLKVPHGSIGALATTFPGTTKEAIDDLTDWLHSIWNSSPSSSTSSSSSSIPSISSITNTIANTLSPSPSPSPSPDPTTTTTSTSTSTSSTPSHSHSHSHSHPSSSSKSSKKSKTKSTS